MKLVFIENNRPLTDSMTVAETFGKEHRRVMQDIRELDCSKSFNERNFVLTTYRDSMNREKPKYLITQDGFSFLAMGYTGKEAAVFKETYIDEFNRMRDELNKPQFRLPQNMVEAVECYLGELKKNVTLENENILLLQQTNQQEQQLTIQAPKVAMYDLAMTADSVQPVGTVAKELGLGRTRLFTLLREKKILRQNNEPYQEFIDRGYFKLRLYTITHKSSGLENKTQPMVTAKGMAWLHKSIKEGA